MPVLQRFVDLDVREKPLVQEEHHAPETLVSAAHGPPGALEPLLPRHPFGETDFAYLYRQLQSLDAALGGGGAGDVVTEGQTNTFTTNQFITMTDLTSTVIPLLIDIENNATGVSYALRLAHRYAGGVGPVGLGVGISLEVESGTEGVKNSIAAFEAQSTVNTAGTMTGEAGINVVVAGNPERILTLGHQRIRNHFQPLAATTHALFELGTGSFVGDASGTYYGARAVTGFTGDFINLQKNGVSQFRVDENGAVFVQGVQLTGGGDALIGASNAWSAAQTFTLNDANPTSVVLPVSLSHTHSGGAGQNNIGVGLGFVLENAEASARGAGSIDMVATNAANANFTTHLAFWTYNNNVIRRAMFLKDDSVRFESQITPTADYALLCLGQGSFAGGANTFAGSANGTVIGANQDPGFTGDWLSFQEDGAVRTRITGPGEMTQCVFDGATTGPSTPMRLEHRINTAGTPAVGMGVALEFWGHDAAKTIRQYGKITADARVLTAAAVSADLVLSHSIAGVETEALRCRASDGNVRVIGKLLAQGGLGPGNRVARTALASPGTVTGAVEFFDAFTGASIGSVPLYANGSFS